MVINLEGLSNPQVDRHPMPRLILIREITHGRSGDGDVRAVAALHPRTKIAMLPYHAAAPMDGELHTHHMLHWNLKPAEDW